MDFIKTEHQVIRAEWKESKGKWELKVCNLQTGSVLDDECDFLLDSCGILKQVLISALKALDAQSDHNIASNWKWPSIPGLHDFNGDLVHSANWPETFDYANKTVALIGNGSSGVQILPEVQKGKCFPDLLGLLLLTAVVSQMPDT